MPNSVKKEEVEQVVETVTPVVEEVVVPVVETPVEVKPSFNKEEIVAKLAELASIFRTMYGEQLNPVFAEIHKSLSNAQYKIMQNL
jgi:predicted SpoU family rRNA methylase